MLNSKIVKISLLSIAFVAVAFFSTASVEARQAENCYTSGYFALPYCTCTSYVCYSVGSEVWDGNYLPSDGTITRYGEGCSNGSGWTSTIGEWGNALYCYNGSR